MKNPYSIGRLVYLRAPTEEDARGSWHEWFSSEEVTRYLGDRNLPNTVEDQLSVLKTRNNANNVLLSVVRIEDDKHIGVACLGSINWVHRYADISVVIGDEESRKNQHYGIEVHALLIKIAFLRLNLLNLKSIYSSHQHLTRMLMQLFRFKDAGRFVDMSEVDGRKCDHIFSQLNRDDWLARNSS